MGAALTFAKAAIANWRLILGVAVVGGLLLFAGWQYVGRERAEKALADVKLKQEQEDNAAWRELNDKREAFEAEVRRGFDTLTRKVADLESANTAFQSKVKANANSNRPLDPVERDALRMLGNIHADQAGGSAVQPSRAVQGLRGGQDRH